MPTHLKLADKLLKDAMKLGNFKTKTEAVSVIVETCVWASFLREKPDQNTPHPDPLPIRWGEGRSIPARGRVTER